MNQNGVIIVATTSSALKAEKVLRSAGFKVQLIPTPREFSSDCGLALRFFWNQRVETQAILANAEVEVLGIHQLE
ncbi:MAG: DUF3343 domain-containing protein [Anaerolineae bacterium]